MIYFSADDYGLDAVSDKHIVECIDSGALDKVSVFANFNDVDVKSLAEKVRVCLHLNLVEGRCMAEDVPLLCDENGNFRHTFGGLLGLSILKKKELEKQLEKEIRAQVLYWKNALPQGVPFCVDSHQHTHMIPSVMSSLTKVLTEENIRVDYLRIPTEPLMPYIKNPSLFFCFSAVNVIKQWLLNFLWIFNRKKAKDFPSAHFMGILFSGKMDRRVEKVLPQYKKLAEKSGRDIEVLFHPGYMNPIDFKSRNIVFEEFYLSENRKIEYNTLKGSVR